MSFGVRVKYETLRSIDSATFTGSYQNLGTALSNPAIIVKLVNNSDQLVTLSTDGTNDHDIFPTGSFTLYDYSANKQNAPYLAAAKGTQYRVKGSAGTGLVYLVVQYAEEP